MRNVAEQVYVFFLFWFYYIRKQREMLLLQKHGGTKVNELGAVGAA